MHAAFPGFGYAKNLLPANSYDIQINAEPGGDIEFSAAAGGRIGQFFAGDGITGFIVKLAGKILMNPDRMPPMKPAFLNQVPEQGIGLGAFSPPSNSAVKKQPCLRQVRVQRIVDELNIRIHYG